jgi:hypothetical protein
MTTAAELSARTTCEDLRRQLTTARNTIVELNACKFRLNGLIVARDTEIAALTATIIRLQAQLTALQAEHAERVRDLAFEHGLRVKLEKQLDAAREGLLELPYLGAGQSWDLTILANGV